MPAYGRRLAALFPLLAALAAPTAAGADSTLVQVSAGLLRVDGIKGTPSQVEVRYKRAAEAGFGGLTDRFLISDESGLQAVGADCAAVSATQASCNAVPVSSIEATLGDGDDVLVLNASNGDGVPKRFPADLNGQGGADVIRAGLGNDVVRGDAGRDVVAGWSGNDLLFGGTGSDGLIGFAGDDILQGENGRDALFGQKGRDRMFGGAQNDVLLARDGFRDPQLVCGPGKRQQAVTDRHDPDARGCRTPRSKNGKKAKQAATAAKRLLGP
jgi:hypothetical protein